MTVLIPVVAGLAVGIGFIVAFGMYFIQTIPQSPSTYQTNLVKLISSVDADCTDPRCAVEIVSRCDRSQVAVVPYDDIHAWVVEPFETTPDFCRVFFSEIDVLSTGPFTDSRYYDCNIHEEEMIGIRTSSFEMLLSNVSRDSGWQCGLSVP